MDEELIQSQPESLPIWVIFMVAGILLSSIFSFIYVSIQKRKFKRAQHELSHLPQEWKNLMQDKDIAGKPLTNCSCISKNTKTKKY